MRSGSRYYTCSNSHASGNAEDVRHRDSGGEGGEGVRCGEGREGRKQCGFHCLLKRECQ